MRTTLTRGLIAAMLCSAATPAFAQADQWKLFQGAPKITDSEGNNIRVRGRIMYDIVSLEETFAGMSREINDTYVRQGRVGFDGQYDDVKFVFEVDFQGSQVAVTDANFTYVGWPVNVKIGQQRTTNSLEENTSSRHTLFVERAQITDAVGLDRRLGVSISDSGDGYSWGAGIFGNSIDSYNDAEDTNMALSARGVRYFGDGKDTPLVHLGASWRYSDNDTAGQPSRSARWGLRKNTQRTRPVILGESNLFGFEGIVQQGPAHIQAEYITEKGDTGEVDGFSIAAAYILTGEQRNYKKSSGTWDRTKPASPVSEGGFGLWMVALRHDVVDARSAGNQKSAANSLSLSWLPESHLRFTLQATQADADNFDGDGVQLRLQWDL